MQFVEYYVGVLVLGRLQKSLGPTTIITCLILLLPTYDGLILLLPTYDAKVCKYPMLLKKE